MPLRLDQIIREGKGVCDFSMYEQKLLTFPVSFVEFGIKNFTLSPSLKIKYQNQINTLFMMLCFVNYLES